MASAKHLNAGRRVIWLKTIVNYFGSMGAYRSITHEQKKTLISLSSVYSLEYTTVFYNCGVLPPKKAKNCHLSSRAGGTAVSSIH